MNDTLYFLRKHMYYLKSIGELKEVSSFIKHQSSETNPWKQYIPMEAQIYHIWQKTPVNSNQNTKSHNKFAF